MYYFIIHLLYQLQCYIFKTTLPKKLCSFNTLLDYHVYSNVYMKDKCFAHSITVICLVYIHIYRYFVILVVFIQTTYYITYSSFMRTIVSYIAQFNRIFSLYFKWCFLHIWKPGSRYGEVSSYISKPLYV